MVVVQGQLQIASDGKQEGGCSPEREILGAQNDRRYRCSTQPGLSELRDYATVASRENATYFHTKDRLMELFFSDWNIEHIAPLARYHESLQTR